MNAEKERSAQGVWGSKVANFKYLGAQFTSDKSVPQKGTELNNY